MRYDKLGKQIQMKIVFNRNQYDCVFFRGPARFLQLFLLNWHECRYTSSDMACLLLAVTCSLHLQMWQSAPHGPNWPSYFRDGTEIVEKLAIGLHVRFG